MRWSTARNGAASGTDGGRAQTETIGFVLLFAVLITAAVGWQVGVVPGQNERVEYNHVQEVQSQMTDLGATVGSIDEASGPQDVPVSLGNRFPDRTLFVNPPPTGGRLATLGSDADGFAVNVTNATAVDAEVDDYWTGENKSFGTAAFVYDPLLQAYQSGPERVVFENSLVYSTYDDYRRQHADQGIVNGRDVNLALVNGSYSKASSGEVAPTDVPLYPASASPTTVRVRNTSGPIQIRVPTDLDQSEWEDRLSDELDDTGPDDPDAYVKNVEVKPAAIGPEDWDLLVLTLEGNETYRLQVSKVRVGSPPKTGERPEYVTVVDWNTATVRQGNEHRVTFEVRDRYDNPVSNATVNVSLRNGDPGALYFEGGTNTTDIRTGPDGRVTVTYAAGEVDGDQAVSVRVNRSGSSSFNRDQNATAFVDFTVVDTDGSGTGNTGNGGGGGGAYTVQWNASRGVSGTPTVTVDTSTRSTLRLNATTSDVGSARVEFSVNDSNRISINRADDRSASNRTARVTFDVSGTGYVYAYVTGGGSGDRVRVKLEQSGDTTDPSVDVTTPGTGSTTRAPSVSGTASDDVAVAGVELEIRRDDGSYWNGGGWQSTATTVAARASDGSFDETSEGWTYSLAGVGDAAVSVTATATDGAGNDATATRAFTRYRGLHVNFQPESAAVPGGYVKDYGQTYQQVGAYTYGWDETTGPTRERNAVGDQRYDTLNHFEHTGDPDRTWELAIPDGTYTVRIAMGDPSYTDQNDTVTVEGARLVDADGEDNFDEYTATVTVTDGRLTIAPGSGSTNSKVNFVDVAPAGNASVPAFTTLPSDPIAGEPVTFDASGTTDPQSDVTRYRWNWDDNAVFEATGESATHTFDSPGTYTVTLEVTDADGNNVTVTRDVTVDRQGIGINDDFEGGRSLDANANWSRVNAPAGEVFVTSGSALSNSPTRAVHIADVGTDGGIVSTTVDTSGRPSVNVTVAVKQGEPGGDPPESGEDLLVQYRASDGTWTTVQTVSATGSNEPYQQLSATLTEADALHSNFAVRIVQTSTSFDDSWFVDDICVSAGAYNCQPTANLTFSPPSPYAGTTVTFDGGDSLDVDGSITNYEWAFGDGTTATGESVTHTYSSAGTYQVTLTVTDDEGATLTTTTSVTVQSTSGTLYYVGDGAALEGGDNSGSIDTDPRGGIEFNVSNGHAQPVTLLDVTIDPLNDSIDGLSDKLGGANGEPEVNEIVVIADTENGYVDYQLTDTEYQSVPAGGLVVDLDSSASVNNGNPVMSSGSEAWFYIYELYDQSGPTNVNMTGERVEITVRYEVQGSTLTETFTMELVGGPVAEAGPDTTVDEGSTTTLDASGSSSPGGSITSYEWAITESPSGVPVSITNADTSTPTATFDATGVDVTGNEEVEVTLTTTNEVGRTSTDTVNVTINDQDSVVPTVSIDAVSDLGIGFCGVFGCVGAADFVVDWSANDSEDDIQTATVQLVDSTGTVVDSQTYNYAGAGVVGESTSLSVIGGYGEEYTIRVVVTDSVTNDGEDSEEHDADGDGTGTPP